MCSNSAMKCHCARHLWRCNLTHWIPLSLTHQMSPSLNGDRQQGAPYCEIPRKLDNANSLSVRHLHRFVSKQAMTPEVKERKHGVQAIIQWWGLPCFCRSCYIERIWKDYFLNVNCFFRSPRVWSFFGTLWYFISNGLGGTGPMVSLQIPDLGIQSQNSQAWNLRASRYQLPVHCSFALRNWRNFKGFG